MTKWGNLVYDYEAIIHLILYYKSDEQMSALQKLLDMMKDANGILDDKKYLSFMSNLALRLSQNADLKEMIFGQVFPFGFAYDFENNYWFTREFSIQRLFGFSDNINNLAKIFGMDIYGEKVVFRLPMLDADGYLVTDEFGNMYMVEYRVESWVGTYGGDSFIGGETGIYTRIIVYDKDGNPSPLPGFSSYKNNPLQGNLTFQSIILDELPMKTYVYNRNNSDEPLLEYDTRDHELNGDDYWPYCVTDNIDSLTKEDLIYKIEYEIKDDRLLDKFYDAAEENENWNVTLSGNIITIEWDPLAQKE